MKFAGLSAVLTLALTACGSQAPSAKKAEVTATASGGSWNARDACATLGKDAAASAAGVAVSELQNEGISEGGDGRAAAATCTVIFQGGGTLMMVTREAPTADATPEAIENARTGGGMMPPSDSVPGLGKAAFWGNKAKQLQVFLDDRRYVAINFFNMPAGGDDRARSIAVAKALM